MATKTSGRRARAAKDPDRAWFEKVVERMRHGFIDGQDATMEFLDQRGWERGGYGSCHTFWIAKMADVDVSTPVMKRVAYQMFDEGLSPRQVTKAVKDIGPIIAAGLKRQKDNGLSSDEASFIDRKGPQSKPDSTTQFVAFEVPLDDWAADEWAPKLAQLNVTVHQFAYEATVKAIKKVKLASGS